MHQKENGHVQIANTLIESMAQIKIPGNCWRVLFWVLRNSYGFNRKNTQKTSARQISRVIYLDSTSVDWAIKWLLDKKMISAKDGVYYFLKSAFPLPLPPNGLGTPPNGLGTPPNGLGTPPNGLGTLNYKKDNLKDNKKDTVSFSLFWKAYPKKKFRAYALKAWIEEKPPLDKCLSALAWQIKSEDWKNAAFIPNPAKWIEGECWNDIPLGHKIVNCSKCGAEGVLPSETYGKPVCRKCKSESVSINADNPTGGR